PEQFEAGRGETGAGRHALLASRVPLRGGAGGEFFAGGDAGGNGNPVAGLTADEETTVGVFGRSDGGEEVFVAEIVLRNGARPEGPRSSVRSGRTVARSWSSGSDASSGGRAPPIRTVRATWPAGARCEKSDEEKSTPRTERFSTAGTRTPKPSSGWAI